METGSIESAYLDILVSRFAILVIHQRSQIETFRPIRKMGFITSGKLEPRTFNPSASSGIMLPVTKALLARKKEDG